METTVQKLNWKYITVVDKYGKHLQIHSKCLMV